MEFRNLLAVLDVLWIPLHEVAALAPLTFDHIIGRLDHRPASLSLISFFLRKLNTLRYRHVLEDIKLMKYYIVETCVIIKCTIVMCVRWTRQVIFKAALARFKDSLSQFVLDIRPLGLHGLLLLLL